MFKVGDKIKIIGNMNTQHHIITEVMRNQCGEDIYILDNDYTTIWYENELMLYEGEDKNMRNLIKVKIILYSGETYITSTSIPLVDIMGYIDTKETITIGNYGLRTKDIKRVVRIQ